MNQKSLLVVVCKIKTQMPARIRIVIIELLVTEDMYDGLYDKPWESWPFKLPVSLRYGDVSESLTRRAAQR